MYRPSSGRPCGSTTLFKRVHQCLGMHGVGSFLEPWSPSCGGCASKVPPGTTMVLNTPLRVWEWVRKRGELNIIGTRSKAVRGKNRPRLWTASTTGVTPSGDGWLKALVDILLQMHGQGWMQDDHTGKLISRDGEKVYQSRHAWMRMCPS